MNGTRDFALEQELSIEDRTKKRRIVLPGSSMSVASAEGSHWDTAVAILMLRHAMMTKPLNCSETKNSEHSENLENSGFTRKQSKEADAKMREAHAAE